MLQEGAHPAQVEGSMFRANPESADVSGAMGSDYEPAMPPLYERVQQLEAQNLELARRLARTQEQGRELHRAFDSNPIACCLLDASGNIQASNAAAAALLGSRPAELSRRNLTALFSGGDLRAFERYLQQHAAGDASARPPFVVRQQLGLAPGESVQPAASPCSLELRLEQPGKVIRARLVSLGSSSGGSGSGGSGSGGSGSAADGPVSDAVERSPAALRQYLVSLEDVTAFCRVQEDEVRFRQIAAQVEDVYYQTDETSRVTYLSSAYQHVWGKDVLEARGKPWFQAVHVEDVQKAEEAFRLLLKGDPFDIEYRIVRPDGCIRWIHDRTFLVDYPARQVMGVARDVTDDRDLEEELRQAQKLEALGTLASSVAHDFGNLLQGVMGCLNMALRDTTSLERSREYTRQALTAVRGGATLVGQLMKFGRKDRVRPAATLLDATIHECSKLLQRLLGDHIELCIDTGAPSSLIRADPVQIEQILMNLAANARDAMPGGGRLIIRTEDVLDEGGTPSVRLEVRDVGCGMDPETQARVFEPFFTTKAPGRGTGLGLPAVRAVTRSLGGRVDVESKLGCGTSFIFHLPAVSAPAIVQRRARLPFRFTGRVLLVEDDWRVRMSVGQYLEDLGFEVVEAADADEALSRAKGTFALLITDVALPEVSGPRIREMLKSEHPDMKALYISAHPAPYLLQQGLLLANDVILQKPFELKDLEHRLKGLCVQGSGTGSSGSGGRGGAEPKAAALIRTVPNRPACSAQQPH
jgi:PAS domain S-box-containing protein